MNSSAHALQYRSSWQRGAQRAALPRVPSSAGVVCGHASARPQPPMDAVLRRHHREAYAALVVKAAKTENHMFRTYLGITDPRVQRHRLEDAL